MAWLAAIAAEGSVAVPAPLAARDGSLAVEARAEGVPEPRTCAVFEWVEGEQLAEEMTEPNLEALGEVAARLHAVGRVPAAGRHEGLGFALPVPRA